MKWTGLLATVLAVGFTSVAHAQHLPPGGCVLQTISCGQRKIASINGDECNLGNGQYADFWNFDGVSGQHVTIRTTSDDMDTFLALLDPAPQTRTIDDDGGGGTNSLINFNLDASGTWFIAVSNSIGFDFGGYVLDLQCSEPSCVPDQDTLCLNNGRFKVEATYATAQVPSGPASVVKLTDETGYLWFFNQNNVETVVKVLNACGVNNRYWVFAAGLTNQGVGITITDTQHPAAVKHYFNPLNTTFVTRTDTDAFATCP